MQSKITEYFLNIKIIGVGRAGCNAVNNMIRNQLLGAEFIVADTKGQSLENSLAGKRIQLGPILTASNGAETDYQSGKSAALESYVELKNIFQGTDMVFIVAGLGGKTGTGAAPIIAKICKELGALTIAIVTKPFSTKKNKRMHHAESGWNKLKGQSDTILTIPNDVLLSVINKKKSLTNMYQIADARILQAVKCIVDILIVPSHVGVDFNDVCSIIKDSSSSVLGIGVAKGMDRAKEAANHAIRNLSLEKTGITDARGVILIISAAENTFTMAEFMAASTITENATFRGADIITIPLFDDSCGEELKVTIIATGY